MRILWFYALAATAAFLVATLPAAGAATVEIFPSNADAGCDEQFVKAAGALRPGDVLILHGGMYSQTCRRAITVNGTAAHPITIRAATGETAIITRPLAAGFSYDHNNIEIVNSSHLVIKGLRFRGGSSGINFVGGHHITFEGNEIYETGNNAFRLNSGNTDAFIIRGNHIHHTGLLASSVGLTEGEGMYIGCNNATCIATNHLIEGNVIHHTRATSDGGNDGIEVKVGSYGNIIRNNVIHDTVSGKQYPCIFVYGGGGGLNIVEGNTVWNCGEAIQVVSDAVVRNNLILNSLLTGITAAPHVQVPHVRNVTIVNNTIYGHPEGLYIRWSGANNMVLANNAIYCPGRTAVNASGLAEATVAIRSNYVEGSLTGAAIDGLRFRAGGSAASAFTNPQQFDFWPRPASILTGNADTRFAPALDFNERSRRRLSDVGAYETEGLAVNPGRRVGPGPGRRSSHR